MELQQDFLKLERIWKHIGNDQNGIKWYEMEDGLSRSIAVKTAQLLHMLKKVATLHGRG